MEDKYVPIDCGFYDHFEIAGVRKLPVELKLWDGKIVKGVVKTLNSRNNVGEFVQLESGEEIRLDKVKSINGIEAKGYC